MTSFVSQDIVV